jgi:hypothetical protein
MASLDVLLKGLAQGQLVRYSARSIQAALSAKAYAGFGHRDPIRYGTAMYKVLALGALIRSIRSSASGRKLAIEI